MRFLKYLVLAVCCLSSMVAGQYCFCSTSYAASEDADIIIKCIESEIELLTGVVTLHVAIEEGVSEAAFSVDDLSLLGDGLSDGAILRYQYQLLDSAKFRIDICDLEHNHIRSIVSDGEYINAGTGVLYEVKYFHELSSRDRDEYREETRMELKELLWPYSLLVEHIFPLTRGHESMREAYTSGAYMIRGERSKSGTSELHRVTLDLKLIVPVMSDLTFPTLVWDIDHQKNILVSRKDLYKGEASGWSYVFSDPFQAKKNVWTSQVCRHEYYLDSVLHGAIVSTINLEESSWNNEIDEKTFLLEDHDGLDVKRWGDEESRIAVPPEMLERLQDVAEVPLSALSAYFGPQTLNMLLAILWFTLLAALLLAAFTYLMRRKR